jgi:prefoldin subunit 5
MVSILEQVVDAINKLNDRIDQINTRMTVIEKNIANLSHENQKAQSKLSNIERQTYKAPYISDYGL